METRAAQLSKKQPPDAGALTGRRLDEQEGFIRRAEGRCARAREAVTVAEKALELYRAALAKLDAELAEARTKLSQLKAELADSMGTEGPSTMATVDADAVAIGAQAADALARARSAVECAGAPALSLAMFRLPEALGASIFAGRAVPVVDAPLDPATTFFLHDALQSRVREAAVAGARTAARAQNLRVAAPVPGAAVHGVAADGEGTPRTPR